MGKSFLKIALGFIAGWSLNDFLNRKRNEKIIQEEVESVKQAIRKAMKDDASQEKEGSASNPEKSEEPAKEEKKPTYIFRATQDEYENCDEEIWVSEGLTYYPNADILVDGVKNVISKLAIRNMIGSDFAKYLLDNDSVYFRNEFTKTYYEVIRDNLSAEELKSRYPNMFS